MLKRSVSFALSVLGMAVFSSAQSSGGLAATTSIDRRAILHDTRSFLYRSPFGAVPAGSRVRLRLRTAHAAALRVSARFEQTDQNDKTVARFTLAMHRDAALSKAGYDIWEASFVPGAVAVFRYRFLIRRTGDRVWYSSTAAQQGGPGQVYGGKRLPDFGFTLTSYDPTFQAPVWASGAVMYQIFPDRFFNGDTGNDRAVMDPSFGGTHPVIHTNWADKPIDGFDFFGGDLQGVIDKLPYLKGLGVNAIYLNPIFLAPSNHKYDTSDYLTIDPHYGSMATFQALLKAAGAAGIHVVLDGVFNHTGSDSIYFNRYGHFSGRGAYQSKDSPFYPWYTFDTWPTGYSSFFGIDTLPQLNENAVVKDFIFRRPDSVAQFWLAHGTDGWRLDAVHLKSHAWWQEFRRTIKSRYPEAVLIGEADVTPINATPWLLGNEVDGVMNYRFRQAVLGFFAQGRGGDGTPVALSVSSFYRSLASILEDYPLPALYSSMNLLGSHDTVRILTALLDSTAELKQVATLQFTWLGMPTIFYGDEAGVAGFSDPDDRRTFPWGRENTSLQDHYRALIRLRSANPALRDGSVTPLLLDNKQRVFGYLRHDVRESVAVFINDGKRSARVTVRVPGILSGIRFTDGLSGRSVSVVAGKLSFTLPAIGSVVLVPSASGRYSERVGPRHAT